MARTRYTPLPQLVFNASGMGAVFLGVWGGGGPRCGFSEKLKDPEDPEGNPEKKKEREEKGGKGECVKGRGKGE